MVFLWSQARCGVCVCACTRQQNDYDNDDDDDDQDQSMMMMTIGMTVDSTAIKSQLPQSTQTQQMTLPLESMEGYVNIPYFVVVACESVIDDHQLETRAWTFDLVLKS